MNLSAVDLNLFVVLHAVLQERSATEAAKRLNVTQSAVSNSLARLRELFADPLVVRQGQGLVPMPRALELAPSIEEIVKRVETALDRTEFVPEDSERAFTIGAADNHQACDAPRIAKLFQRELPKADLRVVSTDFLVATDGLATGAADVAIAPAQGILPSYHSLPLFDEHGALVVRRDHPRLKGKITRALFNELPHIDVHVVLGRPGIGHRAASRHWEESGLRRNVVLTVPNFMIAALAAAQTDCIAGLPDRLAAIVCDMLPLKIVPTTFPMPSLTMALVWHERTDADPGAKYFRDLVRRAMMQDVRPKGRI